MNIFDYLREPISITKPIRLIELFAGYGSQAMALRRIGAEFEHYRVVEFDKYAIASYNAVHGTDFSTMDITQVHAVDLAITDTKTFTYLLTYSFPCTDLSVAGKQSQIVAMRGRNPDNPSDRTSGSPTEQRLEPNMSGTSNCLTSVQKDNLVMESVKIKQATKGGYIECDIGGCFDASYPESETRRGRVQDNGNTCPTLAAQNQDICRIEKAGQILNDGSQCGTFVQYSIRKLTPRECGRLMGVSDEDISKMAEVNSNTQLYKQFGNSIVVDVMCAMFKNLNINQK